MRAGRAGFAVKAAQVLLDAADAAGAPDTHNAPLAALLAGSEAWVGAVEPGGALHALLVEQEGDLCGPKPSRAEAVETDGDEDEGSGGGGAAAAAAAAAAAGGGVISGEALLQMLQQMGGFGGGQQEEGGA
ncbi:hypothetical protein MNEG_8567 [Monoraphidium neglectum]|uniref:Uncharacterized protein n=1 Tax=Monoraphidium neglectum TaxID=145388 RepID=A0A0D2M7Q5_9CHLO|nr:hypothetical protein MNEG_8567 [Monoraphidium neglectum]KIY99399.1 hypothetical protein MNEG_8567 [Monoraphidium neglectum]|eukprot:XP_013898419.1 hypothetical protein MNEG_8567 [Monoraphidium neglectum]